MQSVRLIYFLELITVCLILSISIYLEVKTGLTPCPLCLLQRFAFFLLAAFFLLGVILAAFRIRVVISAFSCLFAILGIVLAGRQVFLQHFYAGSNYECGVSLQYMLHVLPLNEVAQKVFSGSAECTERGWEFLSLNMAEWSLLWFVVFFIVTGYLFVKDLKQ